MNGPFRLPAGGRIDRAAPLRFTFDGREYTGFRGDTLASALLASGVRLFGRSFKYHRPRGLMSAGSDEPNALVTVSRDAGRTTPNLTATTVELWDGLAATSQNRWPSLAFDVSQINDLLSPLFVSGFYYKTFMAPKAWWARLYEPLIRASAGFGRAPAAADPDRYANRFAHCDVLVAGAGPAGLAAALAAARSGARVILCDENAEFGGSLLADPTAMIDGRPALDWIAAVVAELAANPRVTLLPRTTAFGWYQDNFVGLLERLTDHLDAPAPGAARERLWQVRTREAVIAAGAIERPLVFPDNDRPGIVLADAARTLLERWGVAVGGRVVVFTATDDAYAAALALKKAGIAVEMVADIRPDLTPAAAAARAAGIAVETARVVDATFGGSALEAVRLGRIRPDGTVAPGERIACDALLHSAGWTPSVHLHSQSRGRLRFDDARGVFLPGEAHEATRCAGACNGAETLAATLAEGWAAGVAAARALGRDAAAAPDLAAEGVAITVGGFFGEVPHARDPHRVKCFVDHQHDVTAKDLRLALREGFRSIEHLKRFTTTGMATDQGKTSNMNALAIAAADLGRPLPEVGLTTFRRPYTPVSFGAFAGVNRGPLFDPVRHTPIHARAVARGALFEDVGQWKRARAFPRPGESLAAAVAREAKTVRDAVGLFDASTLGKIEVVGPDAAVFLDRIYTGRLADLAAGRARYVVMTTEAGTCWDDGIVARLAPDRFHVTTTTGGAAKVLALMEDYRQTEWPDLAVWTTSITERWAVIAVQGPRARAALAPLVADLDLSDEALPHMGVVETTVAGRPARLFRASFTGERGYELNVPADLGAAVWDALLARVEALGGCAYGTDAMHLLRAEKGYVIFGQDADGTLTPFDVGLGWAVARKKPDFVGKVGLTRPEFARSDRPQLVGLLVDDPAVVLEEGAQITAAPNPPPGTHALGHVTSAYASPTLGRGIALAVVEGGRARHGTTLHVPMADRSIAVTVVDPVFWDRDGARLALADDAPATALAAATPVLVSADPLAGLALPASDALTVVPAPAAARFALRLPESDVAAASAVLGFALPTVCGGTATGDRRDALWLGPDEWLIVAAPEVAAEIAAAPLAAPHALVDLADGRVGLDCTGAAVRAALNAGVPLDLDPDAFPVGRATRTLFHKAEIVLWHVAPDRFRLDCARSFVPYVVGCLAEAARGL